MHEEIAYIRRLIETFPLDLNGLTVLTEVASGNYLFTPFIAALAGADMVYAIAKDNRYDMAAHSIAQGETLAKQLHLKNVLFSSVCTDEMLANADIVTNMAALRPINAAMICRLKPTAVIPYMFETWEFRKEDLDIDACREHSILTMGTYENHSKLRLMDETNKYAIVKTLLDHGFSLYDDRYLLVLMNRIIKPIARFFQQNHIACDIINTNKLGDDLIRLNLRNLDDYDAVIIHDLASDAEMIGESGILPLRLFSESERVVPVVHFSGKVANVALHTPQIRWIPTVIAKPGFMSLSISAVGYKPTLKLTFAGMKTGEMMARLRRSGMSCADIVASLEQGSLLQAFPKEVLRYAN